MKNKLCAIFNLAAHYRSSIYCLMDNKFDIDFYITQWEHPPFKEMEYSLLSGYRGSGRKIDLLFGFYWQTKTISLIFKPYQKYVLIGEPFSLSTWVILIVSKILGKKTYVWTHGWYGRESFFKKILKKMFFKMSTKVLLYGNYARELMIKEGFDEKQLVCIYNSLDYKSQLEVRKQIGPTEIYTKHFDNDLPVVIYVGRIQKIKKVEMILSALEQLKTIGKDFNLVVVGKDVDGVNLKRKASVMGLLDNVWFYGECFSESVLSELIYNSDLCVSPGNVGLTAIHSLVYGTPVITHDNFKNQMPEFEAISEGITGGFFKENSVEHLSVKIKEWLDRSSKQRGKVRVNCYQIIDQKYNPYTQIETLNRVFKI